MLGTIASFAIGACVDKVLEKAVSTVGMKTAEKIMTKVGVTAISMAVGTVVDKMIDDAKEQLTNAMDAACGVEIIGEVEAE